MLVPVESTALAHARRALSALAPRLALLASTVLAACTLGAPPGFSGGDQWVFPLVGPLEDGVLLVPASVHGKGPYLFALDPDANITALGKDLVDAAQLRLGSGPRRIDETATGLTRVYAEMLELKVAGLSVDRRDVMVFPTGMYDVDGRRVSGVLGRDVLADSLVLGFDRDQGIVMLSTVKAFKVPPDAVPIKYQSVSSRSVNGEPPRIEQQYDPDPSRRPREATLPVADLGTVTPVPRRLATAQIGGASFAMHLDLGAAVSQLPTTSWDRARLAPFAVKMKLVDEAASDRVVDKAGKASQVVLGPAKANDVTFVPFIEKRFATEGVDGALGLDFFRPYSVFAVWDSNTYYLRSRTDAAATAAARLGRWGADLPACAHPGCITAELAGSDAMAMLTVTRDPEAANKPLEVFLGVAPAAGKAAAPLVIELPATADSVTGPVPPEYSGARLTVLDASPFPRVCPGEGGCIMVLGLGFAQATPPPVVGAAAGPAPVTVALEKLHRLTGDAAIAPSADLAGKPIAAAIVKVCLGAEGKVESTKVVKSSGAPIYDDQLQATIKASWTFEPFDGKPVCTSVTFVSH